MEWSKTVAVSACHTYDETTIADILRRQFDALSFDEEIFRGKNVVIKPNLVIKKTPDKMATVHPAVLSALLTVLSERGVTPVIAESPGGVYNHQRLEGIYRTCGIAEVAERHGATLNYDTGAVDMTFPEGRRTKLFHILAPIAKADIIIDLCKLKSHSLTKMSGAVKNFFGTIPGIEKFEMHATFPDYGDFAAMICDLCQMLCEKKTVIAVTDAIWGMEGNGPTAGKPREIGAILTSGNPFASDILSEHLLGFDGTVPLVREAAERGLCPTSYTELSLLGDDPEGLVLSDFAEPDNAKRGTVGALSFFSGGKVGRFFMPRPTVMADKCRGCGECVASCPQHTVKMAVKNGKKRAIIRHGDCIRCYCCQELCPFEAIYVKRNLITNLISKV